MALKKSTSRPYLQGMMLCVSFCFFIFASPARGHKVYLFAWVEGNTVYTESYFGGKKKAIGGLIKVFDSTGKKLLEGKTNEKGEFSFTIPEKTDLKIVLEASMGHKAEFVLKADEIGGAGKEETLTPPQKEPHASTEQVKALDLDQIRAVVEEALDSRLKPIMKTLIKLQKEKGPGVTEVLGGIGYILGLMGLVAYFKTRKKDHT